MAKTPSYFDEICERCGCTYGSHHGGTRPWPRDYCPGHEDRMDWDEGPGTVFKGSGELNEKYTWHTRPTEAGKGPSFSIEVSDGENFAELTIFHNNDLRFLQEIRQKVNKAITAFVAENGETSINEPH